MQSPYQNVAWTASEWRQLLDEGTRVLRKGGRQLIFCSNTLRRELEALVDSEKSLKMDCPYVWERAGNMLTWADRAQFHYREPALEFVLVIQQRHEVAAGTLAQSAQGASRILGQFGRPEGASVKHPDLYRELLSRYEPGVVLDYCMNTGACGRAALKLGHRFLGVELVSDIYSQALANFGSKGEITKPKRKAGVLCSICTLNPVDTRPCMGNGSKCTRCGTYLMRHGEEWHAGVKRGRPKSTRSQTA